MRAAGIRETGLVSRGWDRRLGNADFLAEGAPQDEDSPVVPEHRGRSDILVFQGDDGRAIALPDFDEEFFEGYLLQLFWRWLGLGGQAGG